MKYDAVPCIFESPPFWLSIFPPAFWKNPSVMNYGNLMRYGGGYLIQNYLDGRMSAASICDFNDPFELHHRPGRPPTDVEKMQRARDAAKRNRDEFEARMMVRGKNLKRAKRAVNKALRKKTGNPFGPITPMLIESHRERALRVFDAATKVICCSKGLDRHPGEIPMWGYYAECHRGIRIHYTPEFYLRDGILTKPMEYEKEPVEFGFPELSEVGMSAYIKRALVRKAESWEHEDEVRLFVPVGMLSQADDGTGSKTMRWWIKTELAHVARVDLGIKFDNFALVDRLKAEAPAVEIYQTSRDPNAYLCQYDRVH